MKCLIICGGKGTRMGSLGERIPKCLLTVRDKPVLLHQIELLKKYGINDIILCTGHLAERIKAFAGDGRKFGVKIRYAHEEVPLGTAGAIKNAEKLLSGSNELLVLFGDIMLEMNISKLIEAHRKADAIATIVVHKSDHPKDSTCVELDSGGYVKRMYRGIGTLTKTSIHVLDSRILKVIPTGKSSLEDEILPAVIEAGEKIFAYYSNEYIKDIGTPERHAEVNARYSDSD